MIAPRAFRATELSKELARQGHDVTVYFPTDGRDYSTFGNEYNLKIRNLGTLKWREIKLKGGGFELFARRAIRRGLQMLLEWPDIELMFLVSEKLNNEYGYDILISIAVPYPIHWGVARAWTKNHRIAECWIADCGDPYMGDTTDSFRKLFYFKYLEKWFCRKVDYITIPFEGARSAYYPEFKDKIRIIPQGFPFDNLNLPDYRKICDYPVFAYAGGFIPRRRDPSALLDFLSACDRPFRFIIYTSQIDIILPFKIILSEKLEIRESIPRNELLVLLSGMDFLINFDNNSEHHLPSKLVDYAITGRPVLNITSKPDFSFLIEFMNGNYRNKMKLDPPVNYDIKEVAKRFTHLQETT